jgi:hypothetical protein
MQYQLLASEGGTGAAGTAILGLNQTTKFKFESIFNSEAWSQLLAKKMQNSALKSFVVWSGRTQLPEYTP